MDLVYIWYDDRNWPKILFSTIPTPMHDHKVKVTGKKNGTSCSSLGTQTYGVELGLVDPVSG